MPPTVIVHAGVAHLQDISSSYVHVGREVGTITIMGGAHGLRGIFTGFLVVILSTLSGGWNAQ